jgi:hypothetical protein
MGPEECLETIVYNAIGNALGVTVVALVMWSYRKIKSSFSEEACVIDGLTDVDDGLAGVRWRPIPTPE